MPDRVSADALDVLLADGPLAEPGAVVPPTLESVPFQVLVRPGEIDGHAVQVRVQSADRRPFLAALSAIDRGVEAELADARAEYLAGAGQELVAARERVYRAAGTPKPGRGCRWTGRAPLQNLAPNRCTSYDRTAGPAARP